MTKTTENLSQTTIFIVTVNYVPGKGLKKH